MCRLGRALNFNPPASVSTSEFTGLVLSVLTLTYLLLKKTEACRTYPSNRGKGRIREVLGESLFEGLFVIIVFQITLLIFFKHDSFICSLNRCLLCIYFVPGTTPLVELTFLPWEAKKKKNQ